MKLDEFENYAGEPSIWVALMMVAIVVIALGVAVISGLTQMV
jgi:hypothetical protein